MKKFKTRREKLKDKIEFELNSPIPNILYILDSVDEYEKDNLGTIKNLKREKTITLKKINGAIKSFFNAHPVFRKELTGSLSKRIYGALLNPNEKEKEHNVFIKKIKRFLIRTILLILILPTMALLGLLIIITWEKDFNNYPKRWIEWMNKTWN